MNATGDYRAVLWTIVRSLTPAEQIAALTDAVNSLAAAGKLKRGNAQSVLTKLDNAARQLTHGHENVAAQMLGQFVQKVAELVAGGNLSNSVRSVADRRRAKAHQPIDHVSDGL
jgi:FIMAH domain-containing protein